MVGPGPIGDELDAILALAARTPDHGKLAPWRFVVVAADQRGELSALLMRALDENDPNAGDAHRHKADEFARSGEALVVLISAPVSPHKIPLWEQELSVGAAAMNLLHAVHAHGYVGSWLTGWAAYDPLVRDAFCIAPSERIAGFFFIGSPARPLEERPRPDPQMVIRRWSPPL
jgi:nitroreductase